MAIQLIRYNKQFILSPVENLFNPANKVMIMNYLFQKIMLKVRCRIIYKSVAGS